MVALVTGVVCEGIFEKGQQRLEEECALREARAEVLRRRVEDLFAEADLSSRADSAVPHGELAHLIPNIIDLFESHNISVASEDIEAVLAGMRRDQFDELSKEEFCEAVVALADRGHAPSLAELSHTLRSVQRTLIKWEPAIHQMSRAQGSADTYAGETARRLRDWVGQCGESNTEVLRRSQEQTGSVNQVLQRLADVTELVRDVAETQQRLEGRLEALEKPKKSQVSSIWESATSLTGGVTAAAPAEDPKRKAKAGAEVGYKR